MKTSLKTSLIIGGACLAFAATSVSAQTTVTTVEHQDGSTTTKTVEKDHGGTAPGAVGGAVAGALVAGPIGAVVGGIAGATVGHAAAPPSEVRTYVTTQTNAPVVYSGPIEVGKPVTGTVTWMEVPKYNKYHWAYLNDQRVVVDDNHNVVAIYTN